MRRKYALGLISLLLTFLVACGSKEDVTSPETEQQDEQKEEPVEQAISNVEPAEIDFSDFGEEVGLSIDTPASEIETVLPLKGTIERASELNGDYLWVIIRKSDSIEEIDSKEFEHYIPIRNGEFSAELNLHNGEGEYRVTVRLPATDTEKDNRFYDAAKFKVNNLGEEIARDIEYTRYGIEKELTLSDAIKGWNHASETIEIEGTVSDDYNGKVLLAEVKKDGEKNKIAFPIKDGSFKGEIPLYYGEGSHSILLQLYSDDEEEKEGTYYDAALFYVNNESAKEFPEITLYGSYIESGMAIESPSWDIDTELDAIEYPIKGTIDKSASKAHTVSHVIVKVQHLDERDDEATYYFPVEDYEFEGIAHFRFGPGEYEVTIHVPEGEQKRSGFRFISALSIKHEVKNIKDKRDILPSSGVESEDPKIIKQADKITRGIDDEREKAKAIYEFVAKHVEYDVEKFKDNVFHPNDSALATLDSGTGICQDYTFLTMALLRSIDIESRYIRGYAGGRHAWVEANINGKWIEMDPTWGAGYVHRNEFHFKYNEDYFDPDPDFLGETHRRQGFMY